MAGHDTHLSKGKPVDPHFWDKFWASYERGILPIRSLDQSIDHIKRKHYPEIWAWEQAQKASAGVMLPSPSTDPAQGGGVDQSSSLLSRVTAAVSTASVADAAVTADTADATPSSSAACAATSAVLTKPNIQQCSSSSHPATRWQLLRKRFRRENYCQEQGSQQCQQQQQQLQDEGRQLLFARPSHVHSITSAVVGSIQPACGEGCTCTSQHPNPAIDAHPFTPSPYTLRLHPRRTMPQLSATPCTADHSNSTWLQKETAEEAAANRSWRQSLQRAKYLLMLEEDAERSDIEQQIT